MKPWINLEYFYNKALQLFDKIIELLIKLASIAVEIKMFSLVISAILIGGIVYIIYKITRLKQGGLRDILDIIPEEIAPEERHDRWNAIEKHLESANSSDWRMAILEADNLLDEILTKIGIEGENLGERLRNIEAPDFDNLQNAWDAHKVRNRIAHEGAKFNLTHDETERVIELYKKALKEFKFI